MIPLPYGLSFFEWSALVAEQYPGIDMYDGTGDDQDVSWREWGEKVRLLDDFILVPETWAFAKWQDWGERVVDALQ